jgi:hypothetical protein
MPKAGYEFEKAVFAFVNTLDPTAEVLFDHKVFDKDTGTLRQCDVWINAKFGGHLPLSILVSCKDYDRKLHIGDIGAFCNEVRSTGASTGVIYSRTGFSQNGIAKGKANGISCCKLYQNEPPDIPNSIWFDHFACYVSAQIKVIRDFDEKKYTVWNDLFDIKISEDNTTILDVLAKAFLDEGEKIVAELTENLSIENHRLPRNWASEVTFDLNETDNLRIQVIGNWKLYRARTEASLLNGSYCLTDNSFKGEMVGPAIDTQGSHPGEQWELITDNDFLLPKNAILVVLFPPTHVQEQFRAAIGSKSIIERENAG